MSGTNKKITTYSRGNIPNLSWYYLIRLIIRSRLYYYFIITEIRFLSGTIWVIFWGVSKTGFPLVFNLQFLDFTYLQTWEYPIKLFKVESLGLGLGLRFWGLNSHRLSKNPIFGGAPEKTPVGTRLKPLSYYYSNTS